MERLVEKSLYASRWLLAPIYLGLSLTLLAIGLKFFEELFHLFPQIFQMKEAELILHVLTFVISAWGMAMIDRTKPSTDHR